MKNTKECLLLEKVLNCPYCEKSMTDIGTLFYCDCSPDFAINISDGKRLEITMDKERLRNLWMIATKQADEWESKWLQQHAKLKASELEIERLKSEAHAPYQLAAERQILLNIANQKIEALRKENDYHKRMWEGQINRTKILEQKLTILHTPYRIRQYETAEEIYNKTERLDGWLYYKLFSLDELKKLELNAIKYGMKLAVDKIPISASIKNNDWCDGYDEALDDFKRAILAAEEKLKSV